LARILCPDPFFITQVSAVRALGRRGDTCEVAWPYGAFKKFFKSRYVREVHRVGDLATEPDQFAEDVISLCRRKSFDVVLPASIESTEALIPVMPELQKHVATLLPTEAQLAIGTDKSKTFEFCEQFDILHPRTWTIRNAEHAGRISAEASYPLVLKHTRNLGGSRGVRFVGNLGELVEAYEYLSELRADNSPVLAQEYVPGLLFDAVTVARDGECPQVFTSARKLMYPVSGGVTCVSVSTRSEELKATARKIVRELNWNGPIEMEFKLDARDGRFKLIEINPRFWASLGTAISCGVDFPGIAVDLALGRKVKNTDEHEYGARHKYLLGRVPYAYWQLARVNGLGAIRDPQQYVRTTYDIDIKDPLPDLFTVLLLVRDLLVGKFPKNLSDGARQMILPLDIEVPYV
jgi:predicted ATP-grasp superfamily ATP-dependent carboligase